MSNYDTFTANEAFAMIEDMVASDGEDFHMNSAIVIQPPMEEAEAVTDEDSAHDDTGDVNHLTRRILTAFISSLLLFLYTLHFDALSLNL